MLLQGKQGGGGGTAEAPWMVLTTCGPTAVPEPCLCRWWRWRKCGGREEGFGSQGQLRLQRLSSDAGYLNVSKMSNMCLGVYYGAGEGPPLEELPGRTGQYVGCMVRLRLIRFLRICRLFYKGFQTFLGLVWMD